MKRFNIKRIIGLILLCFFLTGCAKDETNLVINNDKSVDLIVNIGYPIASDKKLDINETKNTVSNNGFSVDTYHDDKFSGLRLTKKYNNINKISSNKMEPVNLANAITDNFDDSVLFTVKKGFFKNIYSAKYNYDFRDIYKYKYKMYFFGSDSVPESKEMFEKINEYINTNDLNIEVVTYDPTTNPDDFSLMKELLNKNNSSYNSIPVIFIGNESWNGYNEENMNAVLNKMDNINESYIDIMSDENDSSDYELIFNLKTTNKIISSNASSNTNGYLSWNCNYFDNNEINFSFSVFNVSSIIIIGIILFSIFTGGIVFLIFYKKYLDDRNKFIKNNTNIDNILPEIDDKNQISSVNDLMNK